jgi:hypothetical protein
LSALSCTPTPLDHGDTHRTEDALPTIDQEPNDGPEEASSLGDGGRGSLGPHDVDYYRIDHISALSRLTVSSASGAALRIDLVRSDEALEASLQARDSLVVGETAEALFLAIRPVDAVETDYRIDIEPLDLPELGTLLTEPNDTDTAIIVESIPSRLAGFYDGPGDRDALRIPMALLRERAATTIEVSPVAAARPIMRLLSPDGVLIAEAAAQRPGDGVGIPNLGPVANLEQLIVELRDGEGSTAGPYTVSLHAPTLQGTLVELEPNDIAEQARQLDTETRGRGFFHRPDDIDLFVLPSGEGGSVTLIAEPDNTTDLSLRISGADGPGLTLDEAGAGGIEAICAYGISRGNRLVEVAVRSAPEGLSGYQLLKRLETEPIEWEPNNSAGAPGVREVTDTMRGYIYPEGDVDVFEFRVFASIDGPVTRTIEVDPPRGVDVTLEVVDDEGLPVQIAHAGGAGDRERVTVDLPTGSYTAIVRGVDGASCERPYEVTIE